MAASTASSIRSAAPGASRPRALPDLPEGRPAVAPPEARGLARDGVGLLVARGTGVEHARFRDLTRFLEAGDLLVVNTSATLPAAVDGDRGSRGGVTVHFSTALPDGTWAVEVRPAGRAEGPVEDTDRGDRISLPGGARLTLLEPWPAAPDAGPRRPRLWRGEVSGGAVRTLLRRHGRPIAYSYVRERWPLESYQTIFAREPGSAEMPSAGRPFSHRLVTELTSRGVAIAPVVLHTAVSSLEPGEPPLPEPFRVPAPTAARVNGVRAGGGRIIAVGTTAARAVESATSAGGAVVGVEGWTDLVLSPDRPPRVVGGLITGWHPAAASHLLLLEAVAGEAVVRRAYAAAVAHGYLWHEFGDSCILLP